MQELTLIILLFIATAIVIFVSKNNFIFFLVGLELLFLAINLQWINYSIILNDNMGAAISLILIALAAIDAAIGLSLLLKYFGVSINGSVQLSRLVYLKG